MSGSGSPVSSPLNISITQSPAVDGILLKALFGAASWLAIWAITNLHLANMDPKVLGLAIFGVLVSVATLAFGYINSRLMQAKSVTAGVNLALSGASINVPSAPGLSTPVPVTPASAAQIVKEFGDKTVAIPNEPELTAQLNQTQLISAK